MSELQRSGLSFITQDVHQAQKRFHNGENMRDQINIWMGGRSSPSNRGVMAARR
jgi:hypothetical protein